jgi:hypothetical protein
VEVGEHHLVDIGMGVPPVHEPLAPIAQGKLPVGNGQALEVERSQKPQAILERAAVRHHGWLNHPHFPQRATMWYRIDRGIQRDRVGSEPDPRGRLPQPLAGKEDRGDGQ